MHIKCADCGCSPEDCNISNSPNECTNCTLEECCCWTSKRSQIELKVQVQNVERGGVSPAKLRILMANCITVVGGKRNNIHFSVLHSVI